MKLARAGRGRNARRQKITHGACAMLALHLSDGMDSPHLSYQCIAVPTCRSTSLN